MQGEDNPAPVNMSVSTTASDQASTIVDLNQGNPDSKSPYRHDSPSEQTLPSPNSVRDVEKGPADDSDVQALPTEPEAVDPNIVDWEGPDDPLHPHNWPRAKKIAVVGSISAITFLTPLGSAIFAPGVGDVMKEFESTSSTLASFVVSVYLLGFAFGPLVIAPLSELYGRAPLYHVCNTLFIIFNVACALSNSLESLIVFRFFAGCAGSAPLSIGAGSLADIVRQERRGVAMASWVLGPVIGPVAGPVAGGYLTEALGWRWTFWVLAIMSGAITLNSIFWMTESYHPILLERKTQRLIKETGNTDLKSAMASTKEPKETIRLAIVRPTKLLFKSPIVFLFSVYTGVVFGYMYLLFTTITAVFMRGYGFSQGNVGLTFLGLGIGSVLGLGTLAVVSDRILKALADKHGGELKPEYRLPPMFIAAFTIPMGLFWYGWSAHAHLHYIMPIIGTLWVGIGMMCSMMPTSAYLIDAYPRYAASAMAANTLFRSVVGAVLPLAGAPMYAALGLGWGNSLLAFIAVALAPVPFLFFMYGERIRTSKRFQLEL